MTLESPSRYRPPRAPRIGVKLGDVSASVWGSQSQSIPLDPDTDSDPDRTHRVGNL